MKELEHAINQAIEEHELSHGWSNLIKQELKEVKHEDEIVKIAQAFHLLL